MDVAAESRVIDSKCDCTFANTGILTSAEGIGSLGDPYIVIGRHYDEVWCNNGTGKVGELLWLWVRKSVALRPCRIRPGAHLVSTG